MSKKQFYILPEDRSWAEKRVVELEKQIQHMGPDFYEVFEQSSETWHDNAPFDALREKQSVLDSELQELRKILRSAAPSLPKPKKGMVAIGSEVVLVSEDERRSYRIAGDWTAQAGVTIDGSLVVSRQTPIAKALLGKKHGDSVALPPRDLLFTVSEIK